MGKCTWVGKGLCSSPVDADWTTEAELRYGLCVVNYVASNCISQSPDVLEFRKKYSLSLSNTEIYAGRSRDLNWKISRFYGPFQNFETKVSVIISSHLYKSHGEAWNNLRCLYMDVPV